MTSQRTPKQHADNLRLPRPSAANIARPTAVEPRHPCQEWSLVIGHGPATTSFLRPWPRSHFSITSFHLPDRGEQILIFGGEAYDGRELTFYSDLYRLEMGAVEVDTPLPWEWLGRRTESLRELFE
ncbi:unnamed protein product [Durusdinium trenchii]|uniref:Uncharacterized protein n=1 Tax=Durusdinium trenchii TaxID=1381693 RepID=A0ABP0LUJ9_9DINO